METDVQRGSSVIEATESRDGAAGKESEEDRAHGTFRCRM